MSWWHHKCCGKQGIPCAVCSSGRMPTGGWLVSVPPGFFATAAAPKDCVDCDELNADFVCDKTDAVCQEVTDPDPFSDGYCCCAYYEFPVPVCNIARIEVWLQGDIGSSDARMEVLWRTAPGSDLECAPEIEETVLLSLHRDFATPIPVDCDAIAALELRASRGGTIGCNLTWIPFPPIGPWVTVSAIT